MLVEPAVVFRATLVDRGFGSGARRFMLECPEVGRFVCGFTGWSRVEPGSFTCDGAIPLPVGALRHVTELAEMPADFVRITDPNDARIAALRGEPKYYGGVVEVVAMRRRAVLSQQPRPAVGSRLEILSDVRLRSALSRGDGDLEAGASVILAVYDAEDWAASVS